MRWLLAAAFLVMAGVVTWLQIDAGSERTLTIEIQPGYALPETEDTYNVVTDRLWVLKPRVAIRSPSLCTRGEYEVSQDGATQGSRDWSSRKHDPNTWWELWGYAGRVVHLVVTATCRAGPDAGLRSAVTANVVIPRRVCVRRPPRVLDLNGEARMYGRALQVGQVVSGGIDVKRGRVVVGLPECNGYHVVLQRGRTFVGGYDPNGRGLSSSGRSAVVARADEHAGGFVPRGLGLRVLPVGTPCVECPVPLPAAFAIRSNLRRVAVRVYAGSVYFGRFDRRYVRVRAGEQAFATCRSASACRIGRAALFQPGERLLLAPPRRRPLARTIPGRARPPDRLLAPELAWMKVGALRRRGERKLLGVLWQRRIRSRPNTVSPQQGLILWRRVEHGWERAYTARLPGWGHFAIDRGDVTGDGQEDLLVRQSEGSGGCGVRAVVAELSGEVRQIFHDEWCETGIAARRGKLLVQTPYGPCPSHPGGAHCYGGLRNELLRWNGRRLVFDRAWISCLRADLDPLRDCRRK
jgi:hypothetical protein